MNRAQLTEAVRKLKTLGLVDYGVTVSAQVMESVLGMKYQSDSWEWRGPMLEIRKYLSELGYFISERGLDEGSIRFLSEVEIPEYLHKRRLKRYEKMHNDLKAAMRLPTARLGDKNIKILNHEQDILSRDLSKLAESDPELREMFCES